MNREQAIDFLKKRPVEYAHLLGFTKLSEMHNRWIKNMVLGEDDYTLQAHRNSYKTTSVSVALALIIVLLPKKNILFMRKTDADAKEIIRQVSKILKDPHTQYFVQNIWGVNLKLPVQTANEITTNLVTGVKGTAQLLGLGLGSSITGKHYDRIFTDDIVNITDRTSRAERERTKLMYQELQNVKNDSGRIFNTGTPWHKEDCFSIMPEAERWDISKTGILTPSKISELRDSMVPSLFAANYELRHIASENVIFLDPKEGGREEMVLNGLMHLDSAFYGEDYTAWSIMAKHGDKYYLYGQIRRKHVEDCYDEIMHDYRRFLCPKLYNESNADKGMVGKELRKKGAKVILYNEDMNKYLKIATYLKAMWKDIVFVEGTDPEYIDQICDYWEDAAHDDAPDSAACLARIFYKKSKTEYTPLWN